MGLRLALKTYIANVSGTMLAKKGVKTVKFIKEIA